MFNLQNPPPNGPDSYLHRNGWLLLCCVVFCFVIPSSPGLLQGSSLPQRKQNRTWHRAADHCTESRWCNETYCNDSRTVRAFACMHFNRGAAAAAATGGTVIFLCKCFSVKSELKRSRLVFSRRRCAAAGFKAMHLK